MSCIAAAVRAANCRKCAAKSASQSTRLLAAAPVNMSAVFCMVMTAIVVVPQAGRSGRLWRLFQVVVFLHQKLARVVSRTGGAAAT